MKKLFSVLLAIAAIASLTCSAFAADYANSGDASYDPTPTVVISQEDSGISMYGRANFAFTLAPGAQKNSPQSYYLDPATDDLVISSLTWDHSGQDVRVGFRNVTTNKNYGYTFTGGSVTNFTLHMGTAPKGEYYIYVLNDGAGSQSITGTISFSI